MIVFVCVLCFVIVLWISVFLIIWLRIVCDGLNVVVVFCVIYVILWLCSVVIFVVESVYMLELLSFIELLVIW